MVIRVFDFNTITRILLIFALHLLYLLELMYLYFIYFVYPFEFIIFFVTMLMVSQTGGGADECSVRYRSRIRGSAEERFLAGKTGV